MKPSSVNVQAGRLLSIVNNLAVLSRIDAQRFKKLDEDGRKELLANFHKIPTTITRASIRASVFCL
jgi:hypothetical protein